METVAIIGAICSVLTLSGSLFFLGNRIGGMDSTIKSLVSDVDGLRVTQATQGEVVNLHGRQIAKLQTLRH